MKKVAAYLPSAFVNDWARGCANCKHGIVSAPELTGACELYLERLVQVIDGDITFCDCQAGTRYHVFLKNRWLFLMDEVKKKPSLSWYVGRKTHPDIETARKAMQGGYAFVKAPSIRFVDKAEPQQDRVVEMEPTP